LSPLIPYFEAPVFNIPLGDWTIPIHGFGVLVAMGFLVGGQVSMNRAKRLGLNPEVINRLIGWLIVGTFVGGHVGYGLMYEPQKYLAQPQEFLKVWQGLSSYGGFAVCVPLSIWFFRKEKVPVWPYLDCLAFGMAIGWFLGRMGCFVAHDHPGTSTDFFLGVYGICPGQGSGIACHDMGLYEAIWSLGMYLAFVAMDKVPRVPGFFVVLLGLSYGPVRFFMDFLRPDETDVRYLGFTPGQYFSVLLTLLTVYYFSRRLKSGDEPFWPDSEADTQSGA
jgi:phosphatidylglycerol:prolipoprotein diacylglycerol transferase